MSFVLDASVTIAWVYRAERTAAVRDVFVRLGAEPCWVPRLWHLEVANVLALNTRRGKHDEQFAFETIRSLQTAQVSVDEHTETHAWKDILALSFQYGLTTYDAAYLELAKRRHCALATLDRELRRAAEAESVPLLGL